MKKILFLIILLIPIFVNAEEETVVSINEKFFKTIVALPYANADESLAVSYTYEVTEEEYNNNEVEIPRNNIIVETTYKKLTVSITLGNGAYKYKAKLHWKNIPKTRSYDIIGIGHYASVTPAVDPSFTQEYCNIDGNCYVSHTHYLKTSTTGEAAVFHLPSGTLTALDQTLLVIVTKTSQNSTITSQVATADYAHATKTISYSNAKKFDIGLGGISLYSSVLSYYDEIPCAQATWSGTW